MKQSVTERIKREKIIVIARKIRKKELLRTAEALFDGGIRLLEITFDGENTNSLNETCEGIAMLCDYFKAEMCIGAGTVTNIEQVKAAADCGAKYIISPNTDALVIEYTKKVGLISIPGALTPTEAVMAYKNGADFVKLFPAGDLGINYIKSLRAPLSHIPFLAVGGVDENNAFEFMKTGITGIGVGSSLLKHELIEREDYNGITELAKIYTEVLKA